MSIVIGDISFDRVRYDAAADVLRVHPSRQTLAGALTG
jgi:hypothetical protein